MKKKLILLFGLFWLSVGVALAGDPAPLLVTPETSVVAKNGVSYIVIAAHPAQTSGQFSGGGGKGGSGGSGANLALSNLSGVAINTSLLPGVNNSIDLGSASFQWRNIYFGGSLIGGSATPSISGTPGSCTVSASGMGTWCWSSTWNAPAYSYNGGAFNPTAMGPTSSTTGDVPDFANSNGNLLSDSGVVAANILTYSSPATGIARTTASSQAVSSSELSGDVTTSGSNAATVVQVEGAAIPTSAKYVATNSSKQLVAASSPFYNIRFWANSISQNLTDYIGATNGPGTTYQQVYFTIANAGTVSNLYCASNAAPGGTTQTFTYTLVYAAQGTTTASSSSLTCQETTGGFNYCSDINSGHNLTVTAGETVAVQVVTSATSGTVATPNCAAQVTNY